jgi:soluble lytic murein transglycosylase
LEIVIFNLLNKFKGEIRIKNSKYEKTKGKKNKVIIIALFLVLIVVLLGPIGFGEKMMKIMYSKKYENLVVIYSEKYQVDSDLIFALIKAESNFNSSAVSGKGAKGLMQLMEETAKDVSKKTDLKIEPDEIGEKLLQADVNIELGTKYISILLEKYNNTAIALTAYNAGIGTVDNWIEKGVIKKDGEDIQNIPYKETNNYVRKILRDYKIYKKLYGKD